MKAILLAAGLLIPGVAFAQAKKPTTASAPHQTPSMTGLGVFKINKTTVAEMPQLCAGLGMSLQESYSLSRTRESGDSLVAFKVPYESDEKYEDASPLASPDPNVTVFYFPEYTVADIRLIEIVAKFYKGVLYEVSTPSPSDLADAFKLKYGAPTLSSLTKPSKCIYNLTGRTVTYNDKSFFERWYNGSIVALSFVGTMRDSHCQEQTISRFSIRNEAQARAIEANESTALAAQQAKARASKRRKLSDL